MPIGFVCCLVECVYDSHASRSDDSCVECGCETVRSFVRSQTTILLFFAIFAIFASTSS